MDALCQRGLVTKTPVSGDQRASTLELTSEGAATVSRAEAEMVSRLGAFLDRTGRRAEATAMLAELGRALDEAHEETHRPPLRSG